MICWAHQILYPDFFDVKFCTLHLQEVAIVLEFAIGQNDSGDIVIEEQGICSLLVEASFRKLTKMAKYSIRYIDNQELVISIKKKVGVCSENGILNYDIIDHNKEFWLDSVRICSELESWEDCLLGRVLTISETDIINLKIGESYELSSEVVGSICRVLSIQWAFYF